MSLKQDFINYVEQASVTYPMPEHLVEYWNKFKGGSSDGEKPMFTDNGKLILTYLKEHPETTTWKSRDIAEGLFISSRSVSGAIRKLVTDGYVDKIGKEPTIYMITEKGKEINID